MTVPRPIEILARRRPGEPRNGIERHPNETDAELATERIHARDPATGLEVWVGLVPPATTDALLAQAERMLRFARTLEPPRSP